MKGKWNYLIVQHNFGSIIIDKMKLKKQYLDNR